MLYNIQLLISVKNLNTIFRVSYIGLVLIFIANMCIWSTIDEQL